VICAYTLQRLRGGIKRGGASQALEQQKIAKTHEHRALWMTDGEQEDT
jgi:hypothetical protein